MGARPLLRGALLVLAAEACFVLATVFAKLAWLEAGVLPLQATFFRFVAGFLAAAVILRVRGGGFLPKRPGVVLARAITNTISAMLFFVAVEHTTVTNANLLNMTYPVFVFFFAPFITGEQGSARGLLYLALALVGAVFVLRPGFGVINNGDLAGLASGLFAGLAIPFLRRARRHDGIWTILFWLMGSGMLVNLVFIAPDLKWPGASPATAALLGSAVLGVAGQFLLTTGYRYIDASRGSVVSSVRILLGALLGVALFADPLEWTLVAGAVLILLALLGASGVLERAPVRVSFRISRG